MAEQDAKSKLKSPVILAAWVCCWLFAALSCYGATSADRLKVVASTSLIGSIVQELGEDKIELATIVPSGMCPGHFDITPMDIQVLEEAQLLLEQGFEGRLFIDDMMKLVGNQEIARIALDVPGNWMVPEVYLKAVDKILEVLSGARPDCSAFFQLRALRYKQEISALSRDIYRQTESIRGAGINLVCSNMQAEFLKWLGFGVAAAYGRPEDLSPRRLKEIIEQAKAADVRLVVDNLQSGAKAAAPIADELHCPHLALTNFPQDCNGKLSYPESLKKNVSVLLQALRE